MAASTVAATSTAIRRRRGVGRKASTHAALIVTALGALVCLVPSPATAIPYLVKTDSGNLEDYIDDFDKGTPGSNSFGYHPADDGQTTTLVTAVGQVLSGNLAQAANTLNPLNYDVIRYTDTGVTPNRPLVVLRERKVNGTYAHAWGLFVFGRPSSKVIFEVPHPKFDMETDRIGVLAFRRADARALLVAGAHRYANGGNPLDDITPDPNPAPADMAHQEVSVFQAVHKRLIHGGVRVVQRHGYGDKQDAGGAEVVVSAGAAPTTLTRGVNDALSQQGFVTCLYDGGDDDPCHFIATTNVQGIATRAVHGEFVHVESHTSIRVDDVAARIRLASTLADAVAPPSG